MSDMDLNKLGDNTPKKGTESVDVKKVTSFDDNNPLKSNNDGNKSKDKLSNSDKDSKDINKSKNESNNNSNKETNNSSDNPNTLRNAGVAKSASDSGFLAVYMIKAMAFFRMLTLMAMSMLTSGANLALTLFLAAIKFGKAVLGGLMAGGQAILGFFSSAAGFFGSAFGIGAAASASMVAVCSLIVAVLITSIGVSANESNNIAVRDGDLESCEVSVDNMINSITPTESDDVIRLNYAKKVYSVFKSYGLDDKQIAGILGNITAESGIAPMTVEGIYGEKYNASYEPRAKALADLNTYTLDDLFPMYASSNISINKSAYMASDNLYYPGIGLVQWTGGNAKKLVDTSKSVGTDWWSLEFQLAYMLAKGSPTGSSNFWETYSSKSFSNATEASIWFAVHYEGNKAHSEDAARTDASNNWYNSMSSWSTDTNYSNSVISMANNMGSVAIDKAVNNKQDSCVRSKNYDNSSSAMAALSYAYPTEIQGVGNDGTPLYQMLHRLIFPGDPFFQSCDRSVAVAVRWSGLDISFPAGPTATQFNYLSTSPKWKSVGIDVTDTTVLQPGDIFVTRGDGHIFMYVGSELVTQVHGDKASAIGDQVSGSIGGGMGQRSPGVSSYNIKSMIDYDSRTYEVFRNVQPDNSDKYSWAGSTVK